MHKALLPTFALSNLLALLAPSQLQGQIFFDRHDVLASVGWIEGAPVIEDITQRKTYEDPRWLAKMLTQFPDADLNEDGELNTMEAVSYHISRVRRFTLQGEELASLPEGTQRWTEHISMRDGETLPVEVYLPPGQGPFPAILIRTARGRIDSALDYGNELLHSGYAVVGGDLTPEGDFINADLLGQMEETQRLNREERAAFNSRRNQRSSANDGADTIAWIAGQPWSNGRIGMTGYSEASAQSKNALSTNPPALDLLVTSIGTVTQTGTDSRLGRAGAIDSATGAFPALPQSWEAPSSAPGKPGGPMLDMPTVPDVIYDDRTAWFDFSVGGAIEEWKKMSANGRARLIVGIGGHGTTRMRSRTQPNYGDCDLLFPEIQAFKILNQENNGEATGSKLYYFLMGDALDPAAPGNVWKVTDHWPITENKVSWYLTADGGLEQARPEESRGSASFTYDPANPIKTAGGNRMPSLFNGPRDQRTLDGRNDLLLFTSAPLEAPIEITGEATVDLYISTNVPDTQFIVQVLDIYPDGYKWPIRDGGVTARYFTGGDGSTPLEKEQVYHLQIPLTPTALVLAKGHRLGIQVMSSHFPAYHVHPNVWDSIDSYDQAQPAQQTIHLSREYPSRIVLPVVLPGESQDYVP